MREAMLAVVRSLWSLLVKLVILSLWMGFKLVHEVSGSVEELLRKKLSS
jgi:hypothetical protein